LTVTALTPRYTFGGSSMAAAAGIDPWLSRVGLFLRLKGVTADPDSEAVEWGHRLEAMVLDRIAETYPLYPAGERVWLDADRPWLVGHPDGVCAIDGAVAVAEAKTTNRWSLRQAGDVPVTWQAQVQTYMHLAGCDRAAIGALVDGQRFTLHVVERDDRAIAALLDRAEEFYGYLMLDELPPFVGHPQEADAVDDLYPDGSGETVRASRDLRKIVDELRLVRGAEQATARERDRLETQIKAALGDATVLVDAHDEPLVTWRNVASRRVDTKALRAAGLYDSFTTETTTRRFTLS